jgi:ADP-ribosylglycohydrolase
MKLKEILLGIAIGDAFGAGVEFQDREWIRANVDFTEFINVRDRIKVSKDKLISFTKDYKAWDYTDDTEMTIGVLKALMSGKEFSKDLLIASWKEEYEKNKWEKGYGRNGHGSMSWYYSGAKTIDEIRDFQRGRNNPGNAPAMRSVMLGLVSEELINDYARINAEATHPNINAVISSQCIARASEYLIIKNGSQKEVIDYCMSNIELNVEYKHYLEEVNKLGRYEELHEKELIILCGNQPIKEPYFLSGIKGVPSDSKYTTGSVLYILKQSKDAMDALKKSINLGGDVDSIASITTGIMAGKSGLKNIPEFMLKNIEGREYLEDLAKKFKEKRKQDLTTSI